MKQFNKFRLNFIFIFLVILIVLYLNNDNKVNASPDSALHDNLLEVSITLNGQNILNATDKENAIQINSSSEVHGELICNLLDNVTIYIKKIKIGFVVFDRDVFSKDVDVNISLKFGDELHISQIFTFMDVLDLENIDFVSGVYYLKYYLYYDLAGSSKIIEGQPFYMKIIGNPLTSVTGIVSTVAVAYAGITTVSLVNSMKNSIPLEVGNSIDNTGIKATNKLLSYYEGKSFKSLQNEVSKASYNYTKTWKTDICAACKIKWPEDTEVCPNCHITLEESRELFSKTLEQKSLDACKEIVDSASTLSIYGITQKMGEGIIPTMSIVSVLINSGLSIAQPRMGKSWNAKTRKLVFKGLSTALISVLWIQAVGFEVISLSMLAIALLTATTPSLIISKILENIIKVKTKLSLGSNIVVN